ncbi:MAG: carbohydrate-binding domain-containing protein [Lachnospiraceae bacterium]|nr:carbohydrate-binding domain-containing protein [Lachnospiraceae bacterium]
MKYKKLLCLLSGVILCFTCTACNRHPTASEPGAPNGSEVAGRDIPDENEIEVAEPDTTKHDFTLISQTEGSFTYKCSECDEEETVTISCDSGTENAYTVENNTITFKNVTAKSAYSISGSFHGNIVIDVTEDYKFELEMSGFELTSYAECPLSVLSGKEVTLSAKKSTENYIYDLREAVDETDEEAVSASVYALCDFNIQGKGSLNVKSVNNNGIHAKDDLTVKNLSLQVDCKDNALKGNDSVTVESGNLVLIARQGDGIKTKNSDVSKKGNQRGTVAITGGDILIYAACDGIDAAYDVTIDESVTNVNLQIYTDKYSKYSEEVTAVSENVYYVRFNSTAYTYSLKFYNNETDAVWYSSSSSTSVGSYRYFPITKPSGYAYVQLYIYSSTQQQGQDGDYLACTEGMTVNNNYDTIALQSRGNSLSYGWTNYTTANQNNFGPGGKPNGGLGGMNEGNTDKGDHSAKGIKSDNAITISAGTITISAYDDAIHANNDVALENGASPLGNVTIAGGSLTLRSNDDGIHGDGKVSVSGSNINVVGSYEGIEGSTVEITGGNIAVISSDDGINGTAASGTSITIAGGDLYVYAGGDGVDSNSQTSYSGIIFSGGTSVIISTGNSDSSIDTERGYQFTGGYVIGIGRSGGMGSEATNCSGFSSVGTSKTLSLQKDAYLIVNDIGVIKMPVAMNAVVVCLGKTSASVSTSTSTSYSLNANGVYWLV